MRVLSQMKNFFQVKESVNQKACDIFISHALILITIKIIYVVVGIDVPSAEKL